MLVAASVVSACFYWDW